MFLHPFELIEMPCGNNTVVKLHIPPHGIRVCTYRLEGKHVTYFAVLEKVLPFSGTYAKMVIVEVDEMLGEIFDILEEHFQNAAVKAWKKLFGNIVLMPYYV